MNSNKWDYNSINSKMKKNSTKKMKKKKKRRQELKEMLRRAEIEQL